MSHTFSSNVAPPGGMRNCPTQPIETPGRSRCATWSMACMRGQSQYWFYAHGMHRNLIALHEPLVAVRSVQASIRLANYAFSASDPKPKESSAHPDARGLVFASGFPMIAVAASGPLRFFGRIASVERDSPEWLRRARGCCRVLLGNAPRLAVSGFSLVLATSSR